MMQSNVALKPENEIDAAVLTKIILDGDISTLTDVQKLQYINALCTHYDLDPLTRPFDIIKDKGGSGREKLYANRSCTDQIRDRRKLSIRITQTKFESDAYVVVCEVSNNERTESATGAVVVKGLYGEAIANAMMKAETKAKRRATLSFVGLGLSDESEVESIPNVQKISLQNEPAVKQELKVTPLPIQADPEVVAPLQPFKPRQNPTLSAEELADMEDSAIIEIEACTTRKDLKAIKEKYPQFAKSDMFVAAGNKRWTEIT